MIGGDIDLTPYRDQLRSLPSSLKVVAFSMESDCDLCPSAVRLLDDLGQAAPQISIERYDLVQHSAKAVELGVDKAPAFLLSSDGPARVRWFGLPLGHETKSFVEDLADVAKGAPRFGGAIEERLKAVHRPTHIQVFVTPTCPYCPRAARLAHRFALANPLIRADVIEVNEFPTVGQVYGVQGVPKIVVNNLLQVEGLPSDGGFAEILELAADPARLAKALHHEHESPA